jgi:cytochrome c553
MKRLAAALTIIAASSPCLAEQRPEWAFFVPTALAATQTAAPDGQALDVLNPPDRYPAEHPAMPAVVAHGSPPQGERTAPLLPCALCHLPNGLGHVESASLAGLPADYIIRQFARQPCIFPRLRRGHGSKYVKPDRSPLLSSTRTR